MPTLLTALQAVLVLLALLMARWNRQDRPYAVMVAFILAADLTRYGLLELLPAAGPQTAQWILFWALDAIWLGWFGAHWLMSLSYAGQRRPLVPLAGGILAGSGCFSYGHIYYWRMLDFFSPRWIWLRCTGLLCLLLAWRNLFLLLLSSRQACRGMGLGLASTMVSIVQLLQWSEASSFMLYKTGLAVYLILGIAVYLRAIYKGVTNGKWWKPGAHGASDGR